MGAPKWPPSPKRSSRPGGAVARLYKSWGPRNGPQAPKYSSRAGGAVARLYKSWGPRNGPQAPKRSSRPRRGRGAPLLRLPVEHERGDRGLAGDPVGQGGRQRATQATTLGGRERDEVGVKRLGLQPDLVLGLAESDHALDGHAGERRRDPGEVFEALVG